MKPGSNATVLNTLRQPIGGLDLLQFFLLLGRRGFHLFLIQGRGWTKMLVLGSEEVATIARAHGAMQVRSPACRTKPGNWRPPAQRISAFSALTRLRLTTVLKDVRALQSLLAKMVRFVGGVG